MEEYRYGDEGEDAFIPELADPALGRAHMTSAAPAEPFKRVLKVMEPLKLPDEMPLSGALPGVWPTWGEFKRFMESLENA